MGQKELLSLLVLCVGFTVSAAAHREDDAPAALMAHEVGLDIHSRWTPTAAVYFDHVSKAIALEAVQVFGGNGYMSEFRVEQLARDSKVLQIYAGTDEIQITHIAKDLLRR